MSGPSQVANQPEAGGPASGGVAAEGLTVAVRASREEIVQDVSLAVGAGEVLGIVGESGSGKTTLGLGMIGYFRRGLEATAGGVWHESADLLEMSAKRLRRLRGSALAYVPQDPGIALDPARRVGPQVLDSLTSHGRTAAEARERVEELWSEVGLEDAPDLQRRYPHQLSGGQLQRVVIAMAFACRPGVIVLDEPTTALDVSTQRRVLDTVTSLCSDSNVAAVYISHDIALVGQIADRIAVMYSGRIVEVGTTAAVLGSPLHPYTRRLLQAVPSMVPGARMVGIQGAPPRPNQRPPGCAFAPRCGLRIRACDLGVPPLAQLGSDGHAARCIRSGEQASRASVTISPAAHTATSGTTTPATPARSNGHAPLLQVEGLAAWYGAWEALRGIDLTVRPGRCLAVVGESGSGKTTLAWCLVGLHGGWQGTARCMGTNLASTARQRSRVELRQLQYVFQNPYSSLNPRRTIGALLAQPLRHFYDYSRAQVNKRVSDALRAVTLPVELMSRYPDELSGGERQRVAIARALIVSPAVLICDEVTSALDVSVQASVVGMLLRLMEEREMGLVFITHDLALAGSIARDVVVLHNGSCVDSGPMDQVLKRPKDRYTAGLLEDVPKVEFELLAGEGPE